MIVDAALPGHWRELDQELRQLGYALDHVRGIVLTHGDTDDIGFAERSQRAPYRGRALRGCESLRAVVREELDPGVA